VDGLRILQKGGAGGTPHVPFVVYKGQPRPSFGAKRPRICDDASNLVDTVPVQEAYHSRAVSSLIQQTEHELAEMNAPQPVLERF